MGQVASKKKRDLCVGAAQEPPFNVSISGRCSVSHSVVDSVIREMLRASRVTKAELSIVFLSDAQMRRLNREALGHDYVTDVVTFNLSDQKKAYSIRHKASGKKRSRCGNTASGLEGEIYVCPGEARRNAREYDEKFESEVLRYIAHGILHLLGFDDATDKQRAEMRSKENKLLECVKY